MRYWIVTGIIVMVIMILLGNAAVLYLAFKMRTVYSYFILAGTSFFSFLAASKLDLLHWLLPSYVKSQVEYLKQRGF
jgi:hypothetical protein